MKVFVSHASTDTWLAERIAERIAEAGAETFLDEHHIALGEDFEEKILGALADSDELLALLTPWALKRPYVGAEIGAAWGQRMLIVGVLHGLTPDELKKEQTAAALLKSRNLCTLNEIEDYFEELAERVERANAKVEVKR